MSITVKEFINMIKDNRKKDATIYINTKNKNLWMIPPGYFINTEELEKSMNEVGDLEVESFFIGIENPAKSVCFSDLFISLNVTDKASRSEDNVSDKDTKSIEEIVDKGKDTCPLCAYINYFLKNPVPKPDIKLPIENRFLDDKKKDDDINTRDTTENDEKLIDDLYKLVVNEAITVPIEFFTNEKCAKDIIRLIVNNVKGVER